MKTTRSGFGMALGVLALAAAAPALAGEPTHSMAALEERVQPGTEIDVIDRQGRIVRGEFVRADDEGVLVTLYGSAEGRRVPAGDIMSVTRPGDSLKNGALIGAAVGALSAIALFVDDTSNQVDPWCTTNGCRVPASILAIGFYTGVGALIDRAVKGRDVVYRAPVGRLSWSVTPHPVPSGAGVQLALQF